MTVGALIVLRNLGQHFERYIVELCMKYTKGWLIQQEQGGEKLKYLFFWGHTPMLKGEIRKTCFSQWWEGHPFTETRIHYPTAEHYMMAGKARLFRDHEMLDKILRASSPGEAKELGRAVRNFDPKVWKAHRSEIVTQANFLKFSQHPELKTFLLNT